MMNSKVRMMYFLLLCCLAGGCLSVEVHQTPSALIQSPGDKVQLFCTHGRTDYRMMLWYLQPHGDTAMTLIGYLNFKVVKMEESYEQVFNITGDLGGTSAKNASLIFQIQGFEQSAVYYCAAIVRCVNYEAYFGQGTKLTVLEPDHDVTPPTVQVFKPSEKECKVKTLVCVASGFYPDHVSVSWEVDGVTETDSVATDNTALREGKHYSLSSRLTVQSKTWFKPSRTFTCRVSFFNGTDTIDVEDSITGETDSGGMPNDTKMKIMQNAKLTYSVLIAKSFIYGVFIMFLVWKLKGLSGKQSSRERSCGLNN
ncbi:M1-specific T cell receptor beta chain-like isoform X7 [Genypterus blacodes]|uniref:M1-specific T cell receptor beta chain-like isoform X7 n=1 Tax=Genypterus blacodes TaxID=154954 RepID=UPI003F7582FB